MPEQWPGVAGDARDEAHGLSVASVLDEACAIRGAISTGVGAVDSFTWHDGERVIRFGEGSLADAPRLIGPAPYIVFTTERARSAAPLIVERAEVVHLVGPGNVDDLAAELRPRVFATTIVALGGGRVIDVAKALAAADPPRRVVAVATTLSGAEMTAIHRHAADVPASAPTVRPAVVINDPALSASQPEAAMLASAMNALGHAAEAPLTVYANPVTTMAADRALHLVESAVDPLDRRALALAALLGGYAIGGAAYGLHHVLSQTLVRYAGLGHGPANAALLAHTAEALAEGRPDRAEQLGRVVAIARRVAPRAGVARLRDLGVEEGSLADLAERATRRRELDLTPPRLSAARVEQLYRSAF